MQIATLFERLGKLPKAQRFGIFGAIYLLVVVVWWFLLYSPATARLAQAETENRDLASQRAQVEERAWRKAEFEQHLQRLFTELKTALQELPDKREMPELLKGMSALAKKAGLEFPSFKPQPEIVRDYVAEIPVALEVEGSFHDIAGFFDRLSRMPRIVYVRDIQMSSPQDRGGKTVLQVKGTAVTFRFLTEGEIGAGGDARQGDREER